MRTEVETRPLPGREAVDYKIRIVRITRTQGFRSSVPHSVGLRGVRHHSIFRLRGVRGACPMAKSYRGLDRQQREDPETLYHIYGERCELMLGG
eukprot:scaffold7225_cov86-Skeletonema_dohrnii-CCMP3373.AAC.1